MASSIGLGGISIDGSDVYWVESRPQEQGRSVIVRCSQDGQQADVTPPMPQTVKTHSMFAPGSMNMAAAPTWSAGAFYFCNDADQRLYRQEG